MSRYFGVIATLLFVILSSATTYLLWTEFQWRVGVQVLVIILVASIGEHYVSGKGYYHYTPVNGLFVGRVPVWIPFMWIVFCHVGFLLALGGGLTEAPAYLSAGMFGLLTDFAAVEPVASRMKGLWLWKPVNNGYFGFVPPQVNRFTAPIGNYLVWFGFPVLASWLLGGLAVLF